MAKASGKPDLPINQNLNADLSDSNQSYRESLDEIRTLLKENLRYTKSLKQNSASQELKSQQELQKMLKENLKVSKELHAMTKKISHWVLTQRIWLVVKILIIVIPIILASIYLPPLLQQAIAPYRELLNFNTGANQNLLLEQLSGQAQENENAGQ
ncbi:hypothetical protein HYZ76_02505 [Candidatus Falkowbacteria bacterium]|nr:hypothetical protein [Candidatus Falkowbacteria bacterium]